MSQLKKKDRLGEENINYQGCLMKIVQYNSTVDIFVEFQDKYKSIVHGAYREFSTGAIRNPYFPSVLNVGIIGQKYSSNTKEYKIWNAMMRRCFAEKYKNQFSAYVDITCCDEWLLYENFYEWMHKQVNFNNWLYDDDWAIDKDILIKGNKIYSPETCLLVPRKVNNLFIKRANDRGSYPIGVTRYGNKFRARCDNPLLDKREHIGLYNTPEKAFYAYKEYKERIIKEVAQEEYDKGNITQQCYEAMMNYKVEITD